MPARQNAIAIPALIDAVTIATKELIAFLRNDARVLSPVPEWSRVSVKNPVAPTMWVANKIIHLNRNDCAITFTVIATSPSSCIKAT